MDASRTRVARLQEGIPTLCVLVASLVILWPAIVGGQVLFWGVPLLQFQPWHQFAKEVVLNGHLPLWNPLVGMGAPLLANAQSALLYPPNWLLLVVPVATGHALLIVAHWVLAGAGMGRLARRLGLGPFAQCVAALAFALSGYAVARAGFLSVNAALAWLPWVILAGDRLTERGAAARCTGLALALTMQMLAGHWQTAWYTWLLLLVWIAARSLADRERWRTAARAALDLMLATGLALALSAAQVLPTLELLRTSSRAAGVDMQTALTYSFWPWRLAGLIAPDIFGNPARDLFWGYANFWEDAIYIGLLPFALGLAALVAWMRGRSQALAWLPRFPFGLLAFSLPVSLLLALGSHTPVFPFLYRWVPTFDLFQAPTRIMVVFVFALSLLAGAGAEGWGSLSPRARAWASRAIVATAAVILAAALGAWWLEVKSSFISSTLHTGIVALACTLVWRFARMEPAAVDSAQRKLWLTGRVAGQGAALLVLGVDLIIAGYGLNPTTSRDLYQPHLPASGKLAGATGEHRYYIPAQDEYAIKFQRFFRFDTFNAVEDWTQVRAFGLPNSGMLDGLSSAGNFDPLQPARTSALLLAVDTLPNDQQLRLWRAMDVGAVVRSGPDAPRVEGLLNDPHRAWGVCRAVWARGAEESLDLLLDPDFDPQQQVILEVGAGDEGTPCRTPPAVALLPSADPNQVALSVKFAEPGFLVLADTFYPGWQARVDGEWVPLVRANYAFRAVRLEPGSHRVDFAYRPLSFLAGAALSVLTCLALATYWVMKRIARGRRSTS
jgi:Bacterial membrane protein YfhO